MPGETDLTLLLRNLQPALDPVAYGFGLVASRAAIPRGLHPLATFEESEGMTLIAPAADLAAEGIRHEAGFARIVLQVHSALSAAGLTAAVAGALAAAGISANVVAAYHHDHVFVPWERRLEAMAVLQGLSPR